MSKLCLHVQKPAAVLTVSVLAGIAAEQLSVVEIWAVFSDLLSVTALQDVLCSCIDPGETNVVLGSNTIWSANISA